MPAHTTLDPNPNGIVEIVRCPVPDEGKHGLLSVTYLLQDPMAEEGEDEKEPRNQGEEVLLSPPVPYEFVRVEIPRATRTAGFFSYLCVRVFTCIRCMLAHHSGGKACLGIFGCACERMNVDWSVGAGNVDVGACMDAQSQGREHAM